MNGSSASASSATDDQPRPEGASTGGRRQPLDPRASTPSRAERKATPFYDAFAEAFDLADPDLWRSNFFAMLRPRLLLRLRAAVARLEYEIHHARRSRRRWRKPFQKAKASSSRTPNTCVGSRGLVRSLRCSTTTRPPAMTPADDDPQSDAEQRGPSRCRAAAHLRRAAGTTIEAARLAVRSGDCRACSSPPPPRQLVAIVAKLQVTAMPAMQAFCPPRKAAPGEDVKPRREAESAATSPLEPDANPRRRQRGLAEVLASSDWRMACAVSSTTASTPQHWLELLCTGAPFREAQGARPTQ